MLHVSVLMDAITKLDTIAIILLFSETLEGFKELAGNI
jgi:hypothetical protein